LKVGALGPGGIVSEKSPSGRQVMPTSRTSRITISSFGRETNADNKRREDKPSM
jgi:hypothetical protein